MTALKTEKKFVYYIGLFCTMSALQVWGVAVYNYILLLWFFYKLVEKKGRISINYKHTAAQFCILFIISIILSILCSVKHLPGEWIASSIKSAVKFIIFFCSIFLFYNRVQLIQLRDSFFQGLKIGTFINLIWGYIQFLLHQIGDIELNKIIFGDILGIGNSDISWATYVAGGSIRITGLSWETANFALIMIIGYILCKKYHQALYIKLLYVIAILLSTSKSAYIAFACVVCFEYIFQNNIKKTFNKRSFLITILFMVGMICIAFLNWSEIYSRVIVVVDSLLNVTHIYRTDRYASSSIHIAYYTNIFKLLSRLPFINIIFGSGFFSTGYIYSSNFLFWSNAISAVGWNPESDFVTLLIGNGIFGAGIYYMFSLKSLWVHLKDEYGLIIVAILSEGITYLIVRGTWSLVVLVFIFADTGILRKNKILYDINY